MKHVIITSSCVPPLQVATEEAEHVSDTEGGGSDDTNGRDEDDLVRPFHFLPKNSNHERVFVVQLEPALMDSDPDYAPKVKRKDFEDDDEGGFEEWVDTGIRMTYHGRLSRGKRKGRMAVGLYTGGIPKGPWILPSVGVGLSYYDTPDYDNTVRFWQFLMGVRAFKTAGYGGLIPPLLKNISEYVGYSDTYPRRSELMSLQAIFDSTRLTPQQVTMLLGSGPQGLDWGSETQRLQDELYDAYM